MRVTEKCFAIWEYLGRHRRYAYTQADIRKGLQRNGGLKKELRNMTANDIREALSLLRFNKLVRRRPTPKGVYWSAQGKWPKSLQKKHGGNFVCY